MTPEGDKMPKRVDIRGFLEQIQHSAWREDYSWIRCKDDCTLTEAVRLTTGLGWPSVQPIDAAIALQMSRRVAGVIMRAADYPLSSFASRRYRVVRAAMERMLLERGAVC